MLDTFQKNSRAYKQSKYFDQTVLKKIELSTCQQAAVGSSQILGALDELIACSDQGQESTASHKENSLDLDQKFDGDGLVLCGCGDGERLNELLSLEASYPLIVIEHDGQRLKAVLDRFDWVNYFKKDRLIFVVPTVQPRELRTISLRESVLKILKFLDRPHPELKWMNIYPKEKQPSFYGKLKSTFEKSHQHYITSLNWHKKDEDHCDVLVVSPSCLIFNDLGECFHELGYQTKIFSIPDEFDVLPEKRRLKIYREITKANPRMIVTRNRVFFGDDQGGASFLPFFEKKIETKVVNWWWDQVDVINWLDYRLYDHDAEVFCLSKTMIESLPRESRRLIPAAVSHFFPQQQEKQLEKKYQVSFVGSCRYDLFLSQMDVLQRVLGLWGLKECINNLRGVFDRRAFKDKYHAFSEIKSSLMTTLKTYEYSFPERVCYVTYLFEMCHSILFRIAGVELLIKKGVDLALFGDEQWLKIKGVPEKNYHGFAKPRQLKRIYKQSRLNLNLNFFQSGGMVNPKVLDISACGEVVLTDHRGELEDLYPDETCRPFVFDDINMLPEMVHDLLSRDLDQHKQAIQRHTQQNHTMLSRASFLAQLIP